MRLTEIVIVVLVLVAVIALFVWYWANRLDRLHRRTDKTRAQLELQLTRRASAALDLAGSQLLDPVSSLLVAEAARHAVEAIGSRTLEQRVEEESELSATLRAALGTGQDIAHLMNREGGVELAGALGAAWYRAQLARRFYNDAVADTLRLRGAWPVSLLHLAGRTPMPQSFDIDDRPPNGLPLSG